MRKIILALMVFMVAACSGPTKQEACIPSRGQDDQQALDGSQIAKAEKLDEALEEAQIISTIVDKIKKKVVGDDLLSFSGAEALFTGFVASPIIQGGISAAFTLYVIVFGILVLGGMIQVTLGEAAIRIGKMAFVAIFALSWPDFYELIGRTSMNFTDEMLGYFMGTFNVGFNIGGVGVDITQNIFGQLDYFIAKIFGAKMMAMLSALMFASGPSGPVYALLIGMAVFFVFKAILSVVLIYCFSLFARAMIFAVAPIFIAFMLFQPTKALFDSWLRQLINYSLQPVLAGACLGFFIAILTPFFQEFLKYEFCWLPVDGTKEVYSWAFMDPDTGNKVDFGAASEPAVDIQRILLFLGFGYIFLNAVKLGQGISAGLSGTMAGDLTKAAQGLGGVGNYLGGEGNRFKHLMNNT